MAERLPGHPRSTRRAIALWTSATRRSCSRAPRRVAGAQAALAAGASVIVLDDGFQNPSLAKDLSVLIVDGRRGIGNGSVFPAGPLRAPLDAQLRHAQALVVVGPPDGAAPLAAAARARNMAV